MVQTYIILILISFVLEIIALSTNSWSYTSNSIGLDTNYGILDLCVSANSTKICQDIATDTDTLIKTSIIYIRVFSIISLLSIVATLFLSELCLFATIGLNILIIVIFFTKVAPRIKQDGAGSNRLGYSSILFFMSTLLLIVALYIHFNEK